MSTAMQVVSGGAVATVGQGGALPALLSTQEEIDLLKESVARDQRLTDSEFGLFVHICRHRGLNPFARQIYAIRRKGKITHQTSIDGFRLIADRTGRYAPGRDATYRYKEDGTLLSATSYVKKLVGGVWHEVAETAYWDEFYPGKRDGFMWDKMPHVMLAKVAEGQALRRAFPEDLSGLYTSDEMAQAGSPDEQETYAEARVEEAQAPREIAPTGTSGFDFGAARTKIEKRIGQEATPSDYEAILQKSESFVESWPEAEKAFALDLIKTGRVALENRVKAANKSIARLKKLFDAADEYAEGNFNGEHKRLLDSMSKIAKAWPEPWRTWLKGRYDALVAQYDFWDSSSEATPSKPILPPKGAAPSATEPGPTLDAVKASMKEGGLNKHGLRALLQEYEVESIERLSASLYGSVIALMRDVSQVANLNREGMQYAVAQSYKAAKSLKDANDKFAAWQEAIGRAYANNDIAAEKLMAHLGQVHEACLKRLGVQARGHAPQPMLL